MSRAYPKREEADQGSTVKFFCFSYNKVLWKYEDGSLPFNSKTYKQDHINNVLEIHNVTVKNSGKYTCLGEDLDFFMFEDNVYLTIIGKLVGILIPEYFYSSGKLKFQLITSISILRFPLFTHSSVLLTCQLLYKLSYYTGLYFILEKKV